MILLRSSIRDEATMDCSDCRDDGSASGAASPASPTSDLPTPFDYENNRNTDWLRADPSTAGAGAASAVSPLPPPLLSPRRSVSAAPGSAGAPVRPTHVLLFIYVSLVLLANLLFLTNPFFSVGPAASLTAVSVLHCIVTVRMLHWIKGSPDFYGQGEMNGLTFWEQLHADGGCGEAMGALVAVPTVICAAAIAACGGVGGWKASTAMAAWSICIVAKAPFMVGVRILGINSTPGIDW